MDILKEKIQKIIDDCYILSRNGFLLKYSNSRTYFDAENIWGKIREYSITGYSECISKIPESECFAKSFLDIERSKPKPFASGVSVYDNENRDIPENKKLQISGIKETFEREDLGQLLKVAELLRSGYDIEFILSYGKEKGHLGDYWSSHFVSLQMEKRSIII